MLTQIRKRILVLISLALMLVAGIGYVALRRMPSPFFPSETKDVRDYGTKLKQWAASGLAAHFPTAVPSHATSVRFCEFPGFLQGGAYIQLRMQLPADEIKLIETQLKQAAAHVYAGGG